MGTSLACGVRAAATAEGWVIALADMPFIQPATISGVARLLADGALLAAPVYQGRRGHPVGFRRELREALTALDGDRGGQALLTRYTDQLCGWPVTDAGILLDVDTPANAVPIQTAGQ
jgi:molybdenum cofactor cytidylyltransferase